MNNSCNPSMPQVKKVGSVSLHVAIVIVTFFSVSASAQKLFKWVDENGNISYQDKPAIDSNISSTQLRENPQTSSSSGSNSALGQSAPIVVYTASDCLACEQVLADFRAMGIPAEERSINDRAIQLRILEATGNLSAPTVFIGENLLSNIGADNLRSAALDAGYTPLLEQQPASTQQSNPTTETNAPTEGNN